MGKRRAGRGLTAVNLSKMGEIWERISLKQIIGRILDWLYPIRCPVCDEILNNTDTGVHKQCRDRLELVKGPVCMHCGRPVVSDRVEYCFDCDKKRKSADGFVFYQGRSLWIYQGAIKKTMYRFKYSNKREYADYFADVATEKLKDWMLDNEVEAIVPVPMYKKKQKKRGYNQAEVFAKALSDKMSIPIWKNDIVRVRDTTPMKQLDDVERKNNLKNAFQMRKNIVKYNHVLIVDDIYTTGSTADEVSRVLREAGVHKIMVLSICIGQGF